MTDPVLTALAAGAVNAAVETLVKPALRSIIKAGQSTLKSASGPTESAIAEYLTGAYQRSAYLSTIALHNKKRFLTDLYQPLTVRQVGSKKGLMIDDYRDDFLPRVKRALITDAAGMGKSTLLRFLLLRTIDTKAGIPVYLELRRLTKSTSVENLIQAQFSSLVEDAERELLFQLIRKGGFIFLLDGFDEIPLADRDTVAIDLQGFFARASKNLFVITSRPEVALAAFPDFTQFSIEGLTLEEAFALLRRYDTEGSVAEEIIGHLKGDILSAVREFLSNPLLVSLLYRSYEHKPTIPLRKHIFYRQVYDALYDAHDLTKGGGYARAKVSGLDIEQFHMVLRVLGFITLSLGKVEYDRDELIALITRAKERCATLTFREADLLADLLVSVPIFVREGSLLRWSHKSLQDYFAAQFICQDSKDHQAALLQRLVGDRSSLRFLNVLDLCADIDLRSFRHAVLYPIAVAFLEHNESAYQDVYPHVDIREIMRRRARTYSTTVLFVAPAPAESEVGVKEHNIAKRAFEHMEGALSASRSTEQSFYVLAFLDGGGVAYNDLQLRRLLQIAAKRGEQAFSTLVDVPPGASAQLSMPSFLRALAPGSVAELEDSPSLPFNQGAAFADTNRLLDALLGPWLETKSMLHLKETIDAEVAFDKAFLSDLFSGGAEG